MANTATYDRIWRDLYIMLMGGTRIYYPEPHYFMQEQLGVKCCTIFKMKQLVPADLLDDLKFEEFGKKDKDWRRLGNDLYANRLKQEVTAHHWNKGKRKLSQTITYEWGVTPFEEWLEENVNQYWMTAEWFQEENASPFSDFAFLVSVHVPIFVPQKEFDDEYGQALVMTKLMHY
jgi:hypothetical protein